METPIIKVNKYLAKTMHGLETLLQQELQLFGATEIEPTTRGAFFKCDLKTLYKLHLGSRYALRFLKPILSFKAYNEKELYDKIYAINWPTLFSAEKTFKIEHSIFSETFKHAQFASLKAKDAIVDKFRDTLGKRPNIELREPDILINLYFSEQNGSILIDATGKSLHFRGYKKNFNVAPLNEVLAAGMVKLSGWDYETTPFYDPMCGSGTLSIEAALMARNIAPNLKRKEYCFKNWLNFDQDLLDIAVAELKKEENNQAKPLIFASDVSQNAINITTENAERAEVSDLIRTRCKNISQIKPTTETGIAILNPPYGERMGEQNEIEQFYKQIGDALKFNFTGFNAWIISSNIEALKNVGLKPNKRIKLFNGKLECSFNRYNLYSGSKQDLIDAKANDY
ncbi:MAG: THUMP domain-containing class I SAM-dependent RNA methyltransferase [Luteibaculaceae bacterium]